MKKFLVGLLLASGLIAEYPGQPGVIHYDANNYWNMDAGSLFTYKIHSDTIRSNRLESSKALVDSVEAGYIEGRYGEFEITKSGISSRPGGKGGVLTLRFDDGYRGNLRIIAPVLENYGVKAVIGVVAAVPGHVNSPDDAFMTWSEIRQLAHDYEWEIACHSYDHTHHHVDYWEAWLNLVKAKKVIEESVGVKVVTYIAPTGEIRGFDDYFLRKEYWCGLVTGDAYNDFGNMDLYRIQTKQPPLDLNVVADSGYWAVRFFHVGDSSDLEEIESLIVKARELGVEILTPREVIEKCGLLDVSPLRIVWDIEVGRSFQWLSTWADSIMDLTDPDTSKFEVWNESDLVGWIIEGSYDSATAETLKSDVISEANNQTIPTPTSLHMWMQAGDSVSLSRYFTSSDSVPVAYLTFYAVRTDFFNPKSWMRWQLEDTTAHKYWDAANSRWISNVVYNDPGPSLGTLCRRGGYYVYDIRPHVYKFTIHYRKDSTDAPEAYFDDLSVTPSTTGDVKVRVMFKKPQWYDTKIQSEIDMLFDNGVGPILTSPGGYKYRLKVDDSGNLSTESVPR